MYTHTHVMPFVMLHIIMVMPVVVSQIIMHHVTNHDTSCHKPSHIMSQIIGFHQPFWLNLVWDAATDGWRGKRAPAACSLDVKTGLRKSEREIVRGVNVCVCVCVCVCV